MSSAAGASIESGVKGRGAPTGIVLALCVLLSASAGLNVWLFRGMQKAVRAARPPVLAVGTQVPALTAKELANDRVETIAYEGSDRPTVLYVFSPQCEWCTRNLASIKSLVEKRKNDYRFVGISLSEQGLREHVAAQGLPFPVYSGLSREAIEAYRLRSTPQTIVVSPQGRVVQSWRGAYTGSLLQEVQSYFGVELPGLAEGA